MEGTYKYHHVQRQLSFASSFFFPPTPSVPFVLQPQMPFGLIYHLSLYLGIKELIEVCSLTNHYLQPYSAHQQKDRRDAEGEGEEGSSGLLADRKDQQSQQYARIHMCVKAIEGKDPQRQEEAMESFKEASKNQAL